MPSMPGSGTAVPPVLPVLPPEVVVEPPEVVVEPPEVEHVMWPQPHECECVPPLLVVVLPPEVVLLLGVGQVQVQPEPQVPVAMAGVAIERLAARAVTIIVVRFISAYPWLPC
jgi:hypothetical protein